MFMTGPVKICTRNRNASSSPRLRSPSTPVQVPTSTTAATTRPDTSTPDEKLSDTRFWARRADSRCRSMLSSTRAPVRASTA